MEQPSEFNKAVTETINNMETYFVSHSHALKEKPPLFADIVKATIIKAYEFVASINGHHEEYMYFTLPSLRGICEEYIVEKFIFVHFPESKDEIIQLRHSYDHFKSAIVQWKYFEINRPDQLLYYKDDFPGQMKAIQNKLRTIIRTKLPAAPGKGVFPSVYFMSKEIGELELYNYLYHASSTFVHFSPNNLLRMGWGNLPDVQFSTSHFKLYYKDFSLFYGLLLLSKLCEWQTANGFLPSFDTNHCKTMDAILERAARWPELVTFEEMNIGILSKHLFFKAPNEALKAE